MDWSQQIGGGMAIPTGGSDFSDSRGRHEAATFLLEQVQARVILLRLDAVRRSTGKESLQFVADLCRHQGAAGGFNATWGLSTAETWGRADLQKEIRPGSLDQWQYYEGDGCQFDLREEHGQLAFLVLGELRLARGGTAVRGAVGPGRQQT